MLTAWGPHLCGIDMQNSGFPFRIWADTTFDSSSRVLRVGGEIDVATAPLLHQAILDQIRAGYPIVIDLAEVAFIDAAGVNALIRANQTARGLGLRLTVAHAGGLVGRVLRLTQADRILDIPADPDL